MDQQQPTSPRRRRHRSSPVSRVARGLGLGRRGAGLRIAVLGVALLVAAAAVAVAVADDGPDGPVAAATGAPGRTPAGSATAGGGLPAPTADVVPSLAPIGSVTPGPASSTPAGGVVAKRVRIERLGIDLKIVEGDGIDAPMRKAAHYPGSGWPHGGTNIYIYAHAQEGMFLALWDARVGDVVELDLADGSVARYAITKVKPEVPWNAIEYTHATPDERLTLQTSTSYHPDSPRFLVIAEPVP